MTRITSRLSSSFLCIIFLPVDSIIFVSKFEYIVGRTYNLNIIIFWKHWNQSRKHISLIRLQCRGLDLSKVQTNPEQTFNQFCSWKFYHTVHGVRTDLLGEEGVSTASVTDENNNCLRVSDFSYWEVGFSILSFCGEDRIWQLIFCYAWQSAEQGNHQCQWEDWFHAIEQETKRGCRGRKPGRKPESRAIFESGAWAYISCNLCSCRRGTHFVFRRIIYRHVYNRANTWPSESKYFLISF